jgi:hypothetical protein
MIHATAFACRYKNELDVIDLTMYHDDRRSRWRIWIFDFQPRVLLCKFFKVMAVETIYFLLPSGPNCLR